MLLTAASATLVRGLPTTGVHVLHPPWPVDLHLDLMFYCHLCLLRLAVAAQREAPLHTLRLQPVPYLGLMDQF